MVTAVQGQLIISCLMELVAGSVPHLRHNFINKVVSFEKEQFTLEELFPKRKNMHTIRDHCETFEAMGLLTRSASFKLSHDRAGVMPYLYEKVGLLKRMGREWAEYFN